MICPNCKLENPPEALRCDCGYEFSQRCCGSCGKPIAPTSLNFCVDCGKPISEPKSNQPSAQKEPQVAIASGRRRYMAVGLLIAGLFLSLYPGDTVVLSFFLLLAALGLLLRTGSPILRLGLPFIGALLLLIPGVEIVNRAARQKEQMEKQQAVVIKKALDDAIQEERAGERLKASTSKPAVTKEASSILTPPKDLGWDLLDLTVCQKRSHRVSANR